MGEEGGSMNRKTYPMKHTPGPWRECGADKGGCVCGLIWSTTADRPVAGIEPRPEGFEKMPEGEARANARLIAAAPDLLAALKELVYMIDMHRLAVGGCVDEARKAIERAEGKEG